MHWVVGMQQRNAHFRLRPHRALSGQRLVVRLHVLDRRDGEVGSDCCVVARL